MARKGENIRRRNDGRWEGRYLILENGEARYHSIYAKSYTEVKMKLIEMKSGGDEVQEDVMIDEDVIINDVAESWLRQIKEERKTATYVKYESVYRIYIKDTIGLERICDLNSAFISSFFPDIYSESTIKSIYCVINQIVAYSHQYFRTTEILIKRKMGQRKNTVIRVFSHSEQKSLVRYLYRNMDVYKLGILLCLSVGLRLGEVCALRWEDIDFDMQVLHVKRTVQRIASENSKNKTVLVENEPKTASSKREIPISNQLYDLLKKFKNEDTYLLNGTTPMEPRTYQYKFKKYLKEAGISDANFHVLRHTFATNCIGHGADVKSVSEILGHSDVKITLNRYVHPTLDTKRSNISLLDMVYGKYL